MKKRFFSALLLCLLPWRLAHGADGMAGRVARSDNTVADPLDGVRKRLALYDKSGDTEDLGRAFYAIAALKFESTSARSRADALSLLAEVLAKSYSPSDAKFDPPASDIWRYIIGGKTISVEERADHVIVEKIEGGTFSDGPISPSEIQDPKARAAYEKAVSDYLSEVAKYRGRLQCRIIFREASEYTQRYVNLFYLGKPGGRSEARDILRKSVHDDDVVSALLERATL